MGDQIAIVGASVRAAAGSARRAGFEPVAADLFGDQDLCRRASATRIERYPAGLPDWLRSVRPPAWMYTGALENYPELVDAMASVCPLWGNGGDALRRVRSPWLLADTLHEASLLFPETRDSAAGLPRDGSWLAKTYRGSSGSGVRTFDDTLSLPRDVVYQQRIAGVPCCAVHVATDGAAPLLGVTRQLVGETWLGGGEFQYAGSIGPWPVTDAALATITRIGDVLAERFGLVGLFGVDLIIDGPSVWTIEVNPRYTASVEIIERATGTSAVAAHVAACSDGSLGLSSWGLKGTARAPCGTHGRRWSVRPQPPNTAAVHAFFGKAILFAKRDVAIGDALAAWALREALVEPWPGLADVPAAGTRIAAGRPVMTVFAEGRAVHDVQQQLRRHVARIERRLYAEG